MRERRQYEALGWWKVTTEGDCEGITTTDLGTHYGYLDDIAFQLGRKAYYQLQFKAIDDPSKTIEKMLPADSVSISLDIDSGTWDMTRHDRAQALRDILKGRPVSVEEGVYYASVVLNKERKEGE
jgi:hypothetical protein